MPHPYLSAAPHPRIFAHRGLVAPALAARGVAENSRAAIAAAAASGADYIETDCHLTSDGEVVLFHDADLGRVTGDDRALAAVGSAELAELMRERGGLITLADALAEFPDARFNIDVKAAAAAEPVGRIVAPHADRVLVTSFSDAYRIRALRAAREANPAAAPATSPGRRALIRILAAVAAGARRRTASALAGFDALQIPERRGPVRVLTRRLIDAAHAGGVEVHVWTVNDPRRMVELSELGVDGVITDRADLALTALAAQRAG